MTIDLEFDTEEILKRTQGFTSIGLEARIKSKGTFDQSACARFNSRWLKMIQELPDFPFGVYQHKIYSAVGFAIENVNCHGGDQISLSLKYSNEEVLVTVEDSGKGFDVKGTVGAYRGKEKHYQNSGLGFLGMDNSTAIVTFNETGNKTFIYYKPDSSERQLILDSVKELREQNALCFSAKP